MPEECLITTGRDLRRQEKRSRGNYPMYLDKKMEILEDKQVLPGALNTVTPCAACKLLRRRCVAQECPFFPYFPPYEPHKFASVHKVFGASNVSKMLMEVAERQRADAANSLVYEANVRLRDPVYGCMGVISALQQQVISLQAELNSIKAQILDHKLRENHMMILSPCDHIPLVSISTAVSVAALPPAGSVPPPSSPAPPLSALSYSSHQSVGGGFRTIPSDQNDSYFE